MPKWPLYALLLFAVGMVAAAIGGPHHLGAVFLALLALPVVAGIGLMLWMDSSIKRENRGKTPEQKQAELNALVDRVSDHNQRQRERERRERN